MWIMVFFDLPTNTDKERKSASKFRKNLIEDGFTMFQYSIYMRHCPSSENAEVHIKRVKKCLPKYGHVAIIKITDYQFSQMEVYTNLIETAKPKMCQQLEIF